MNKGAWAVREVLGDENSEIFKKIESDKKTLEDIDMH